MSIFTNFEVDLYTKEEGSEKPPNAPDSSDTGLFTHTTSASGTQAGEVNTYSLVFLGGFCVLLLLALFVPKVYALINKRRNGKNYYNLKKTPSFRKIRATTLSLAIVSMGVGVFTTAMAYVVDQEKDVSASKNLSLNAPILGTDDIAYVHDKITVPKTEAGFNLYITSDLTDLVDIYNSSHRIKSITSAGKLSDNTYGVYVGKEAPTKDSTFLPIYSNLEQYSIFSTNSTEAQTIDVWYAVRSKENKEAIYSTKLKINAVGIHSVSMQEMTQDICAELETGVMDYKFYDSRDGKEYTVAKYKDGNCWMAENLDLELSTEKTLTSEDTDLPEGSTWTPSSNTMSASEKSYYYSKSIVKKGYYEEKGEYVTEITYGNDIQYGAIKYVDEISYEEIIDDNGKTVSKTIYEYKDDNLTNKKTYDAEGNLLENEVFTYDEGVLVDTTVYDKDGQVIPGTVIEDDDFCFVRTWEYWDDDHSRGWNIDSINPNKCSDKSYKTEIEGIGTHYSLNSATAGASNFKYDEEKDYYVYDNATTSICPANWKMAKIKDYVKLFKEYLNLETFEIYGVAEDEENLEAALPSFMPSGAYISDPEYVPGFEGDPGYEFIYKDDDVIAGMFAPGIYWAVEKNINDGTGEVTYDTIYESFEQYLQSDEYDGDFDDDVLILTLFSGMSVRCLMYNQDYYINFDDGIEDEAILVENMPENQRIAATEENEDGLVLELSDVIPTRSDGYEFLGWATSKADALEKRISYYAGTNVVIKMKNITLYAVWDEASLIKNPYAVKTENNILTFIYTDEPIHEGDDFVTHNGETSKIVDLYEVPLTNLATVEEMVPDVLVTLYFAESSLADGTEFLKHFYDEGFVPDWAFEYLGSGNKDDGIKKYNSINFDKSFVNFRPESTAFWFAGVITKTIDNIEYLNTSEVEMMSGMFAFIRVYDFDDPNFDELNATFILDVSHFATSKVKSMFAMFLFNVLGDVNGVSNFDTRSLEDVRMMFCGSVAKRISVLDLSYWDTSRIKYFDYMFLLSSVPNWKWDSKKVNVVARGYLIKGLEKWDTSSAQSMDGMFYISAASAGSLKTQNGKKVLDLTGWDVGNVKTMDLTFASMFVLEESSGDKFDGKFTIDLSGWDTSGVESMCNMFMSNNAREVILNSSNESGTKTGGWNLSGLKAFPLDKDYADDSSVVLSDNVGGLAGMFDGSEVTQIYSDKDWTVADGVTTEGMFQGARELIGGNGTKYSDGHDDIEYAKVDREGVSGYFTNPNTNTKAIYGSQQTSSNSYAYAPVVETEEPEEAPVSTSSEKKEAKKSETEQEQTNPLGVEKSVEESSTVDTATIAVIVASFVLVSAGAVIIFMIERKRSREDGEY